MLSLLHLQISKYFPEELQTPVQQLKAYQHSLAFPTYRPLGNITWKKTWPTSIMSLIPNNFGFSSVSGLDPIG